MSIQYNTFIKYFFNCREKKYLTDSAFLGLMGKFLWYYHLAGLLFLLGVTQKPLWCQPKQALPVRTFSPGVQLNSPVPINRGNDTLGLEGFMEPEKRYGAKKSSDLKSIPKPELSLEPTIDSYSMFGYEDKEDESNTVMDEDNVVESEEPVFSMEETVGEVDAADAFGATSEDDCPKKSEGNFCSAFN
jgi:hypothetical protein